MKFTLKWLKEYLDTNASCTEICNKLDSIGLEVEEVIDNSSSLSLFNSVFIEGCENHPDSDHLHVCKVKKADGEMLQVVCGAPNAKKGMKAILAPVGSIVPNGNFKISKSKIRGVESCGMLCSEKELGLGENHDGIIELDKDIELGKNVAEIFGLDDVVIDINLTPNRGDCLGVYGIARDLAATGIGNLKEIKDFNINAKIPTPFRVDNRDENCKEIVFRYIKGVKNCESPEWIKEKLKSIGINPKSALVDITNYVMFVLGRPMHCYDADKVFKNIVVKQANGGEKFVALGKNEYVLNKGATLICDDADNILGLGGIIGGADSASMDDTVNVLLECAIFDPISIAKTARALNINTDAKFRFERGVDYKMSEPSLNFATYLIMDICGGQAGEIIKSQRTKFEEKVINFDIANVELILGLKIERSNVISILEKLGYVVKENLKNINELILTVPSWRNDVTIKENVVEDLIRIYGYDNLKEIKINNEKVGENQNNLINKKNYNKLWEATSMLSSTGMVEVISWSFMNEEFASEFSYINNKLKLVNPINSELSYMRPTLIPNLMTIAKYNQDRSIDNICLVEKGRVFLDITPEGQKNMIAGVRIGLTCDKDPHNISRPYSIFDVKKDLFDILKIFGVIGDNLLITNDVPDYYHPYRSGAVKLGNTILGVFGEIHPLKSNRFGLKNRVNAFELYIENLPKIKESNITQKKKFVINDLQPIFRDFAFLIDKELEVGKIIELVKKSNKELIKDVNIFDIYQGKNIDENKKSIAFSIKIQPVVRSLTTEEIDVITDKIIKDITEKFAGILRDKK
mgnify:CR=1 FL=1